MNDATENVGGSPLPPARNRTKPTVIRPASKTQGQSDAAISHHAPPRPAPPAARPPPPPVQRQNEEVKSNNIEATDQEKPFRTSAINRSSSSTIKPGSVKKKLEITIVDARPMSETDFRKMKAGVTSPSVTSSSSDKSSPRPEITRVGDVDGPPKPSRISISRPSLNSEETIPPPKRVRPDSVSSHQAADSEPSGTNESSGPPRPARPTFIRPQSQLQKQSDKKLQEDPANLKTESLQPLVPPGRPKHVPSAVGEPPKLSPTPRPRSTFTPLSEPSKPSSPTEESKNVPVPLPRPTPRNAKDIPVKLNIIAIEASQDGQNGSLETTSSKSSPLEPPQRPKRPSAQSKPSLPGPSAQPKPNLPVKKDNDFTDDSPVYAKIVKPTSKAISSEASPTDSIETKSESHVQARLTSTSSTEEDHGGARLPAETSLGQRLSLTSGLPKPAPKPKPVSRSDSGKTKSSESGSSSEEVGSGVALRSKSSFANEDQAKPGQLSEHFEQTVDLSHVDPEISGPPLPTKRPVTFIGGPQRGQSIKLNEEKAVDKNGKANQFPPSQKLSTSVTPKPEYKTATQVAEVSETKKPVRPGNPPPRPSGGPAGLLDSASQPDPVKVVEKPPTGSLPSTTQLTEKTASATLYPDITKLIKPEKPASSAASKPSRPRVLPRRPRPGHPLYHYLAKQPHGIAVHNYVARQDDELSFKVGETVILVRKEDRHWLVGKVGNKEGLFPANYVDVKCPLPDEVKITENSKTNGDAWEILGACAAEPKIQGPRCKARFDFEGEGDGDLALEDGDVVQIIERVGTEWLRGELKGRRGIFPVSFVEIIEDLQPSSNNVDMKVTAIADFSGQEGELSFLAGDEINVSSQVNKEWLHGELHGKKGRFPVSFVSHIPLNLPEHRPYKKPQAKSLPGEQLSHKIQEEKTATQTLEAEELVNEGPALLQHSKESNIGYCRGRFDYLDPPLGDLAFKTGDRIEILEFYGEDWARGRLGNKEGMFPLNLVAEEIIEPDIVEEPEVKEKVLGRVVHDFQGENEHDLTIKEGDIIEMEEIADTKGNWRWGCLNGKRGMFPVIFVEVM